MHSSSAVDPPSPEPATPAGQARRPVSVALIALGGMAVFLAHFRPWQGGVLEDWGLALAWESEGWSGFGARIDSTLGRPLHLVPHYLGLGLSDGGFVGMYLVLAVVGVAQFAALGWGLRPIIASSWLRWSLGLLVALHPWWIAGGILRFMSAQVAVLGVALWFAATARYLTGGPRWWLMVMVAAPAAGMLSYQATAGPLLVAAVLLSFRVAGMTRKALVTVSAALASVAGVLAWSLVVVPRIVEGSYEENLMNGSLNLGASVQAIARTLLREGEAVVVFGVAVAALVVALAVRRSVTRRAALLLLAGLVASPLTALIYAAEPLHLNDPERLALPTGLTVFAVLVCALALTAVTVRAGQVFAAVVALVSGVAAVSSYVTWDRLTDTQQDLIDQAADARGGVGPGNTLVLVDRTGQYGDVYTLLPPYVQTAIVEEHGPGAPVLLCTPDDTPRDQPDATRLGIIGTPSCTDVLTPGFELVKPLETELGLVDAYEMTPAEQ